LSHLCSADLGFSDKGGSTIKAYANIQKTKTWNLKYFYSPKHLKDILP
jgi:hypothetical protein